VTTGRFAPRSVERRRRFFAAALVFSGGFGHHDDLLVAGQSALSELKAAGWTVPDESSPIRVTPIRSGTAPSHFAGGWRPGYLQIRSEPQGILPRTVYLRHELMHEVSNKTCGGTLPKWAHEALAISFSGEASGVALVASESRAATELFDVVRQDRDVDVKAYESIRVLVAMRGWKVEPESLCDIPERWRDLGQQIPGHEDDAWRLIHLQSGRLLAASGDQKTARPSGSLMKIPLLAALPRDLADRAALQSAMLASDSARIEKLVKGRVDAEAFKSFLSSGPESSAARAVEAQSPATWLDVATGLRDGDGAMLVQETLADLTATLRMALLSDPSRFAFLARNGRSPESTLNSSSEATKVLLENMRAISKTGTNARTDGTPVLGHVMIAWPAESPRFLFVARARGRPGFQVADKFRGELRTFHDGLKDFNFNVRFELLRRLTPAQWRASAACRSGDSSSDNETKGLLPIGVSNALLNPRTSRCGRIEIVTSAPKARARRLVRGIVSDRGGATILETDPWSYAEDVLDAEASGIPAAAHEALRAVVLFNARHVTAGDVVRHRGTHALCDTTHCMVNRGRHPRDSDEKPLGIETIRHSSRLLVMLEALSQPRVLPERWLQFSAGGETPWAKTLGFVEIERRLDISSILGLARTRTRGGSVNFVVHARESSTTLSCEMLRNRLKLLSCPDEALVSGSKVQFRGRGAGHGQGLDMGRAVRLAGEGALPFDILADAWPELRSEVNSGNIPAVRQMDVVSGPPEKGASRN